MIPFKSEQMLVVACSSSDVGPDVKAVCKVGCIGCQGCSKRSDLFKMEDNLSHVDYDAYDPEHMEATEVAIEKCPMKGIIFVGKPSEKDIDLVKDEDVPERIEADFKTTVDDTEWRG
jgi:ferredoxin